jgi:hypothetical protein
MSLYLTNSSNQLFALNQTSSINGTTNSSNWTVELGVGNYTWNCLAYDSANQTDWAENRTLWVSFDKFTVTLSTGNTSAFQLTGRDSHNLTLNSSTNTTAEATFQSDPISLSLTVGGSQSIAAESTTAYDFAVTLDAASTTSATFTIQSTNVAISTSTPATSTPTGGSGGSSGSSLPPTLEVPDVIPDLDIDTSVPAPDITPPPAQVPVESVPQVDGDLPVFGSAIGASALSVLKFLKKNMFAFLIIFITLALAIGSVQIYHATQRKEAHNIDELQDYIQREIWKGKPYQMLYEELIEAGWYKDEIMHTFASLSHHNLDRSIRKSKW